MATDSSKSAGLRASSPEHLRSARSGKLKPGDIVVRVSEDFYRPTDVVNLWGDPTKAKTKLGWNPQKTSYEELCRIMAEHDLLLARKEAAQAR